MARSEDDVKMKMLGSVAGVLEAVVIAVRTAVLKLGGNFSHFHRLTTPEGAETVERIAALIVGKPAEASVATSPSWWSQFLATLIQACNFVSYVDQNITGENFPYREGDPPPKPVTVISIKAELRELGRSWLRTEEVVAYLKSLGYRPATLVELLFWWLQNPAKWSDCLVVALGSGWGRCVPDVCGFGSDRELGLSDASGDWHEDYEFAAVRLDEVQAK